MELTSPSKDVFLHEESDDLRLHDPTLPLLALCFEDDVFEHAQLYEQLKRVSPAAIRAAGNKFPVKVTDQVRLALVCRVQETRRRLGG